MLERLRIQNFKSWQDTGDMAFGSLTGFFGTNSSGKSSILQFLLMLKQTVESSDRSRVLHLGDEHSYVDLGTMYDILYKHEDPGEIYFEVMWKETMWKSKRKQPLQSFSAIVSRYKDNINLTRFSYRVDKLELIFMRRDGRNRKNEYDFFTPIYYNNVEDKNSGPLINPIKFYGFPANFSGIDKSFQYELQFYFENVFTTCYYLGPLRDYPKRTYAWSGEQTHGVGNRGERAIAALLASRNEKSGIDMGRGHRRRTVEEHVAHWLKELGLIYSFKVQPIAPNRKEYEVRIQRTAESASVFLTDVGFGVSQILPVLVLLFYVPEGSTVILEQPEIHLHPAVQAGLADVFIDAIKRRKLQIVLESHSEHLLQRLQRRIAEEVIDEEAIKLYFTSIKEGRSELTTLELDEYGNIHNWPAGFFGNAFEEAAAKMKAEMKRKMKQQ